MTDDDLSQERIDDVDTDKGSMTRREAVRRAWSLLEPADRWKFSGIVFAQMLLAIFDLIGLLLIGLVAALAVAAIQDPNAPPAMGGNVLGRLGLAGVTSINLALYASVAAATALILKSVLSTYAVRRIYGFLSLRQAGVAARLTGQLFERSLTDVQRRTSQQTTNALIDATSAGVVVVLGSFAIALADGVLLVALTGVMFMASPLITIGGILLFVTVAYVLQRVLGRLAGRAGRDVAATNIRGTELIQEALTSYRELTVSGTRTLFRDTIERTIRSGASAMSDTMFVTQVPRYIFETALVVGAMALLITQMRSSSAEEAVATLTLFLAGGSRIMPSVLRLQVSLILIHDFGGRATPAYELSEELQGPAKVVPTLDLAAFERGIESAHADFVATVMMEHVTYRYPNAERDVVVDVTLSVKQGQSLALVGATGAGKSTLADLILGVISPDRGRVVISGLSPGDAVTRWPGAISYVPQAVGMIAGTVRQNVAFGIPDEWVDDGRVWEVLDLAQLGGFLRRSKLGLDTLVGERGTRFSGGQRQRLGIARALYTRPRLLVLDEATSALDAETEAVIASMLASLEGDVTTVTIAHRLATIRGADLVAYLESGRLAAAGSFDDVRREVPAFQRQAALLGL